MKLYDKDFDEYFDCLPTDNVQTMAQYKLTSEIDDDILVISKCQKSNNYMKKSPAEVVEKTGSHADISFTTPSAIANRTEPDPSTNGKII